ncbi:nitrous oxide reductase family maturation protein NosD [Nocardioides sp.]|uniref:right-handed parallel beta-helix repeat-containing protein n=1 Tax=Nocardioides sp. TaxID=35761 RepID=UPI0039E605EF
MRVRAGAAVALLAAVSLTGCGSKTESTSAAMVVRVPEDAATISAAVDKVHEGGLVLVDPGTYDESVTITTKDVTLRGTDRNGVVIDGEGVRPYGVVGIADGVRVENLTVRNHTFYGVLVTGLHDDNGPQANNGSSYTEFDPAKFPPLQRFRIDHVTAYDNGLYGLYAFNTQHGAIVDSYASGSADSGIYVGQCKECDVLVQGNVAERNAVGFENANASTPLVVAGNRFSGNRVGMTFLSNYQEAFRPQAGNTVFGNVVADNSEASSPAQADGGFGIGIGIAGGIGNEFTANLVTGNPRAGVTIANTEDLPTTDDTFTGNSLTGNGVAVANISAARTPATRVCFDSEVDTLPAGLAPLLTGCGDGDLPAVDATRLSELAAAPPGMSFLQVAAPKDQPSMSVSDEVPDPLPDAVEMPAVSDVVPALDLLADLTGTR